MERYGVSFCIQSECGKIWIGKTPNTGTFHAVSAALETAKNNLKLPYFIFKYTLAQLRKGKPETMIDRFFLTRYFLNFFLGLKFHKLSSQTFTAALVT